MGLAADRFAADSVLELEHAGKKVCEDCCAGRAPDLAAFRAACRCCRLSTEDGLPGSWQAMTHSDAACGTCCTPAHLMPQPARGSPLSHHLQMGCQHST